MYLVDLPYGLPHDAMEFLRNQSRLVYDSSRVDCGRVSLRPVDELSLSDLWVNGDERGWNDDPHGSEAGYYTVPVVDLAATAEGFDPVGILAWIPRLEIFCTWDCDHWDLIMFTGVRWAEIVADPAPFLNAQWDPTTVFTYMKPWEHGFAWNHGMPF